MNARPVVNLGGSLHDAVSVSQGRWRYQVFY